MIRVDGGVPSVAPAELAVSDQGLAGEHPQRVGCDGEAGPLPVAEDVLLLDPDLPGVVQLLRRHHLEHGVGVGQGQWPSGQSVGEGDRPVIHGISEPHGTVGTIGICRDRGSTDAREQAEGTGTLRRRVRGADHRRPRRAPPLAALQAPPTPGSLTRQGNWWCRLGRDHHRPTTAPPPVRSTIGTQKVGSRSIADAGV